MFGCAELSSSGVSAEGRGARRQLEDHKVLRLYFRKTRRRCLLVVGNNTGRSVRVGEADDRTASGGEC